MRPRRIGSVQRRRLLIPDPESVWSEEIWTMLPEATGRDDDADVNHHDARDCRPSRQGHAARDPTPRFRSAAGPIPLRSTGLDDSPCCELTRMGFVRDESLFPPEDVAA